MAEFTMSKHALERAVDMAVTAEEIRDCWERPRDRHWSRSSASWLLTYGRVCIAVRETETVPVVTTVLWATAAAWSEDLAHGALAGRRDSYDGIRRVRKAMRKKGKR